MLSPRSPIGMMISALGEPEALELKPPSGPRAPRGRRTIGHNGSSPPKS
jgi:hypothetical protein